MMTSLEGVANATELVVSGAPVPTAAAAGGGGTAEVALASAAAAAPVRRLAAAARRLPGRRQLAATAAPVTPGQVILNNGFEECEKIVPGASRWNENWYTGPLPLWWCRFSSCLFESACHPVHFTAEALFLTMPMLNPNIDAESVPVF